MTTLRERERENATYVKAMSRNIYNTHDQSTMVLLNINSSSKSKLVSVINILTNIF